MQNNKFISIIIPSHNEENFIEDCIRSFSMQDYPKENMEILLVDGNSTDKTVSIVNRLKEELKEIDIRIIKNEKIYTPFALNLGIKNAKGEIIFIVGSHAKYDKDYISKCVESLEKHNADNVGGVLRSIPKEDTLIARSIALSLSSFFGAGNSAFRIGEDKPMEVDTVFGGCYRKEVFDRIGLYNENLIRSQDMEFNIRLKKEGGKIVLDPSIVAYYYPKSTLIGFFKHNFKDGFWSIYPLKFMKMPLKIRHYIPLIFVSTIIISFLFSLLNIILFKFILQISLLLYIMASSLFSLKIVLRERKLDYFSVLMIVFALRHFGYGLGSIWGVLKLAKDRLKYEKD